MTATRKEQIEYVFNEVNRDMVKVYIAYFSDIRKAQKTLKETLKRAPELFGPEVEDRLKKYYQSFSNEEKFLTACYEILSRANRVSDAYSVSVLVDLDKGLDYAYDNLHDAARELNIEWNEEEWD